MKKMDYIKKTTLTLLIIGFVWFALDRIAKAIVSSGAYYTGEKITDSICGIFHITLVKNTGAAFGAFSGFTVVLGIISILICILLVALVWIHFKLYKMEKQTYKMNIVHIISIAVVIAGGLSNAIDRFVFGFVIDYICLDFMTFPVFNIADIGVTCGIILLLISMLIAYFKYGRNSGEKESKKSKSKK